MIRLHSTQTRNIIQYNEIKSNQIKDHDHDHDTYYNDGKERDSTMKQHIRLGLKATSRISIASVTSIHCLRINHEHNACTFMRSD